MSQITLEPGAWESFISELRAIKSENLNGDTLAHRIELAYAPLLEGREDDDCILVYEECMYAAVREAGAPADWAPEH